jgi:hypothetical protein
MEIPLPEPLLPGGTVRLGMTFRTRLPRTVARMGHRGDHYDVMQWFPKVAVLVEGEWNAHEFHAESEFFADFGNYDVTLVVPDGFVVEATGIRTEERIEPGTSNRILRYRAEDVHDFAWIADPNFRRIEETYRGVRIVLLHQPYHRHHVERILASVRSCLDFYGDHLMEYPYPKIVIDDLPMGLSGGMEYPMLFTITIHPPQPSFLRSPEGVTIHEFGHQYWYGILATNEFEEAWLDEGINTYVSSLVEDVHWGLPGTGRTQQVLFRYAAARILEGGAGVDFGSGMRFGISDLLGFRVNPFRSGGTALLPFAFRTNSLHLPGFADPNLLDSRDSYFRVATTDPISRKAWDFLPGSYAPMVYDKTYLFMKTLERTLGPDTVLAGLRDYLREHQFGHPDASDLRVALEAAAGRDLGEYFDQILHGSGILDFSVAAAESLPVVETAGYPLQEAVGEPIGDIIPAALRPEDADLYRTEVILFRGGQVRLPVEVVLRFDDGTEIWEEWNGQDRWERLVYFLPARLISAEIDPDFRLVLDRDRNNNSWTAVSNWKGVAKIASILLFWFQNLLQLSSALS